MFEGDSFYLTFTEMGSIRHIRKRKGPASPTPTSYGLMQTARYSHILPG